MTRCPLCMQPMNDLMDKNQEHGPGKCVISMSEYNKLKCCGNCRYFCYHRIPYGGVLFYCHNNDREYLNRNDLCDKWELIYG